MSTPALSPQAERLQRLIWRLARRDGHAAVRTEKLCAMLAQDAKREAPYSVRAVRYLLAELRAAGLVETQTDYRMLYIRPLVEPARARRSPAPPQPFAPRPVAQQIAHPVAQPEPAKCTANCTAAPYMSSDGEDVRRRTTGQAATPTRERVSEPKPSSVKPLPAPMPLPAVVVEMVKIGWSQPDALRFVAKHGETRCARCLSLPGVRIAANPASFHRRAVEGDWQAAAAAPQMNRGDSSGPPPTAKPVPPPRAFVPSADELAMYYRGMAR